MTMHTTERRKGKACKNANAQGATESEAPSAAAMSTAMSTEKLRLAAEEGDVGEAIAAFFFCFFFVRVRHGVMTGVEWH